MKKPKPRDYGLDSDHPTTFYSALGIDPEVPFTEAELSDAMMRLVKGEALAARVGKYREAMEMHNWANAGR